MTDEPPFTFRQAKATQQPKEDAAHAPPAPTPIPAPAPGVSKRKRRTKAELAATREPSRAVMVELSVAIDAAAALAPSDANAFTALVKILNSQPAAARRRLAKALGRIFQ